MKTFDADQEKAIEAQDGYYLVLAPPGCGKTDILAERIARAKSRGVDFADMLCLTFTNRASRGMRQRVLDVCGSDASSLFVGNIHRFATRYLFENNIIGSNVSVIDDDDQTDYFISIAPDRFISRGRPYKAAIQDVTRLADYVKQRRLGHPEALLTTGNDYDRLFTIAQNYGFVVDALPAEAERLRFALQYTKYKEERSIIDFSDILIYVYHALSAIPGHRRYKWIQVDEVQDLNPLQLAIIDLLTAEENPTVMYLGDEQQAIFSFMGAKLEVLNMLKQRCSGHILTLGRNYRAPKYLLDMCNDYARKELHVDPSLLPEARDDVQQGRFDLILAGSTDVDREVDRVVGMANYYLGLDPDERLAILVATNQSADRISHTLELNGLQNFKISGTDMFRLQSFKTLTSLYAVMVNDFNSVAWARLLTGMRVCHSLLEAREMILAMKKLMMTPSDLMAPTTATASFARAWTEDEIVLFDTETTGLDTLEDDIVQIAAFKVRSGEKVSGSDFNIILHTDRDIPEMLGDHVNPLVAEYASREHVGRAEGLKAFLDYVGDRALVGHNVTYDYQILSANVKRELGIDINYTTYDTLHIIRCVEPNLRVYKLEFLIEQLHLEGKNSHLANEDIEATKSLADYCVSRIKKMLQKQQIYLKSLNTQVYINRISVLSNSLDDINLRIRQIAKCGERDFADELTEMYHKLQKLRYVENLEPKFSVFVNYLRSEWLSENKKETLYDQIHRTIGDITSSLSEGDLVNSSKLIDNRVFVMTVYKAKGLEFDNVIIIGANNGTYPFYQVNKVLGNNHLYTRAEVVEAQKMRDEDARKFYVAITRAKHRLCVSFTDYNSSGKMAGLTPFLDSVKDYFTTGK